MGLYCYKNTWLLIAVLVCVHGLRASLRSNSFEDQVPGVFVLEGLAEGFRVGGVNLSEVGKYEAASDVRLSGARLFWQVCFLTISFLALFKRVVVIRNPGQTASLPRKVKWHILLLQNKSSLIVVRFSVKVSYLVQDNSLYVLHIFFHYIYIYL